MGAILDEYIRLKEKKVMLDQEWCRLEQEKSRVQNLLRGMQDVMNAYNFNGDDVTLPPQLPPTVISNTIPKSGAEGNIIAYYLFIFNHFRLCSLVYKTVFYRHGFFHVLIIY